MSRGARGLQAAIERMAASAGKSNVELLTIKAATAGLGDETIGLIQKLGGSGAAFSAVGKQGVAAMSAIGTAAQGAVGEANTLLSTLFVKLRDVTIQQKALTEGLTVRSTSGAISDKGASLELEKINAVADAERKRILLVYEAEKAELHSAAVAAESAAKKKASNDAYLASLERSVSRIGKPHSEIVAMDLAERGLAEQGAHLVTRLREVDAATGQLGKRAFASRNQLLTLQYTLGDVAASAASGISPLTILLQQGGQVFDAFSGDKGGIGNVFRGLLQIFTPLRIAIAATATSVGVLAYAMFKGAQQSKEFADAIVLSGNYAGQTEGQFNSLAQRISESGHIAASSAREFAQALISTGEIGPVVLERATEAAARFGKATGKSAKEVAADFASLTRDVSAGAARLNQSLNFLTASQLQQIRSLQDSGRETQAVALIFDTLNERLRKTENNLTTLDKIALAIIPSFRSLGDAIVGAFRSETVDDRIKSIQDKLKALRAEQAAPPIVGKAQYLAEREVAIAKLAASERDELRVKEKQDGDAAATAAIANLDKRASAASEYYRNAEKGAKAEIGLKRELAEEERNYQALVARRQSDPKVEVPSDATRAAIQKKIRDSYTDKSASNEAAQVLKAQRDQQLKSIDDQLRSERAAYAFQTQYLNGVYQQQLVSLDDYYAQRQSAADADEAAQRESFARRIKVLEAYAKATPDASEKVTTQTAIRETQAQAEDAELQRQRRNIDLALERAGATKQLTDRIVEFRAQLAQLTGNEEQAAELRTKLAIENARLFSTTAGGQISAKQLADDAAARTNLDKFNSLQRKTAELTSAEALAEEAFTLAAVQRGASLRDTEEGLYAIRSQAIEQLRQQAQAAQELADANKENVAYQIRAAELAVELAKKLDVANPALNRLRESVRGVADAITDDIASAINEFKGFRPLLDAISKDLVRAGTNLFITQPLKVGLEGLFKGVSEGDNPIGNFLKGALGIQGGGISSQTAAVASSTTALLTFTQALAQASAALTLQPTSSSGGGFLSWISGLFGGSSGIAGNDIALAFHAGGIVGRDGMPRAANASMFAGAKRYHGGGLAGLGPSEVPAILMGGPRGRREEVLTAGDSRHADNGGRSKGLFVNNYFTINGQMDRRSQEQIAAAAERGTRRAAARY